MRKIIVLSIFSGLFFTLPLFSFAANGITITSFDVNPKTIGSSAALNYTIKVSVTDAKSVENTCGTNVNWFKWGIYQAGGLLQESSPQALPFNSNTQDYDFSFTGSSHTFTQGTYIYTLKLTCGPSETSLAQSAPVTITSTGSTNTTNTNNNSNTTNTNTTTTTANSCKQDSDCPNGGTCQNGTCIQSYNFQIQNPLNGGPTDLFQLIDIVTQWLLYIAIPIAVLFILWAGFLMLTAGPKPEQFNKGKKMLINIVIGLAVLFIGRGFVSLIQSIIELGGNGTTSSQTPGQNSNGVPPPQGGTFGNAALGHICQHTSDCQTGLVCDNTLCARNSGNLKGETCLDTSNCASGLSCVPSSTVVDGRNVGTCQ